MNILVLESIKILAFFFDFSLKRKVSLYLQVAPGISHLENKHGATKQLTIVHNLPRILVDRSLAWV